MKEYFDGKLTVNMLAHPCSVGITNDNTVNMLLSDWHKICKLSAKFKVCAKIRYASYVSSHQSNVPQSAQQGQEASHCMFVAISALPVALSVR